MLLPAELAEGMNRVVAPVVVLLTEILSGWWIEASPAEYWCRAEARLLRKPSSSEAVRPSSSPRIWSSVRTVKGIFDYFTGTDGRICKGDILGLKDYGCLISYSTVYRRPRPSRHGRRSRSRVDGRTMPRPLLAGDLLFSHSLGLM